MVVLVEIEISTAEIETLDLLASNLNPHPDGTTGSSFVKNLLLSTLGLQKGRHSYI